MGDVGSGAGQAVNPDVTRWREAVHLERRAHARKRFAEVEGRFCDRGELYTHLVKLVHRVMENLSASADAKDTL